MSRLERTLVSWMLWLGATCGHLTAQTVSALRFEPQAVRFLALQYREYRTEFMGCLIGTQSADTIIVERVAPADVAPERSGPNRVIPETRCADAGWPNVVGEIHSHLDGLTSCWFLFPGTTTPSSDAWSFRLSQQLVAAIMCDDSTIVWVERTLREQKAVLPLASGP